MKDKYLRSDFGDRVLQELDFVDLVLVELPPRKVLIDIASG